MTNLTRHSMPLILAASAALSGCPEVRDADEGDETGGTSTTDTGGTSVAAESSDSGIDPDGSTGVATDSGSTDVAEESGTTEAGCATGEMLAETVARPADVVVVFSNAITMDAEALLVTAALNDFVADIDASVEPQVALLSEYPGAGPAGLCIEPPLGGGGCPTDDNNAPAYVHVNTEVFGSTALVSVVDQFAAWMPIVRENSVTHFVVISDDDTNENVGEFTPDISPLVGEYVMHVSVPGEDPDDACMSGGACCTIAIEDAPDYLEHAEVTGGVAHDMCTQDFAGFFTDVADAILAASPDKCRWVAPDGDTDLVNLLLVIDGGAPLLVGRAASLADCNPGVSGWAYDDEDAPTQVQLCPQTCMSIGVADEVIATLQLGCPSVAQG